MHATIDYLLNHGTFDSLQLIVNQQNERFQNLYCGQVWLCLTLYKINGLRAAHSVILKSLCLFCGISGHGISATRVLCNCSHIDAYLLVLYLDIYNCLL